MKKLLTLIFLSMIAFNTIHAEITWKLSNGTLTISGTGEIEDYDGYYDYNNECFCNTPWFDQRGQIKNIVIENGVTSIGESAFGNCI